MPGFFIKAGWRVEHPPGSVRVLEQEVRPLKGDPGWCLPEKESIAQGDQDWSDHPKPLAFSSSSRPPTSVVTPSIPSATDS